MTTTFDTLPSTCEFCGSSLVWDGPNLVCNNPNCCNINDEKLKAWITNIAPVDGLGWKTIKKYLDTISWLENAKTVADIQSRAKLYRFDHVKPNSELDLMNKMLDKLLGKITVSSFLLGLKIPGLGKIGAKNVENLEHPEVAFNSILHYDGSGDWSVNGQNIWIKALQDENTASSLYHEYRKYFIECYNLVKDNIIFNEVTEPKEKTELKGHIVITGTLSVKRDEFIAMVEQYGWLVSSKINKDTKYLITNTPDSGTSKNKEADKYGVPKITELDFVSSYMK